MKHTRLLFGLLAGITLPGIASAQNPQPAPPQVSPAPVAPADAPQPPPERIAPRDESLSDRLSRQQGTLQPPLMDPGIHAPLPPQAKDGTMPVIPPPGSPGGNQKVVPK
ncbi:MAG: hypothetical protein WDN25_24590 [Acetobacteraceae bacterium]